MLQELIAALIIGISFSNAFVCISLAFGVSASEQKNAGVYFIFGRFLGIIIIGLIIALFGVVFDGYIIYFMILFGILTIIFGALVIFKIYLRIKNHESLSACANCNHLNEKSDQKTNCSSCSNSCSVIKDKGSNEPQPCGHQHSCPQKPVFNSKITKRYSFFLGVFRGATPCLKIIILAPLLITADLWLAVLMIIVYATASSIYPIIGFLSASVLTNIRRYEPYIQVAGAVILISLGIFTILKQLSAQSCMLGV